MVELLLGRTTLAGALGGGAIEQIRRETGDSIGHDASRL
jgi:hypothetical protein